MSVLIAPLTGHEAQSFGIAVGPLKATSDLSFGGYTIVTRYQPKTIKASGTNVRLTLHGYVGDNTGTISNVTISRAAISASSNPWDSAVAPTAVTFRGSASVAMTRGSVAVSDNITITIVPTAAYLIAYNMAASSFVSVAQGLDSGYVIYSKATATEAATTDRSPTYIKSAGSSAFLAKIECWS